MPPGYYIPPLRGAIDCEPEDNALRFVAVLVAAGAKIDVYGMGGCPIHHAVRRGYLRVTEFLLTMGTDVNQRGEDDHTPVFIATWRGDVDMVRFLVQRGADPDLRDSVIGRNAWDLANEADKSIRNALVCALNSPRLHTSTSL